MLQNRENFLNPMVELSFPIRGETFPSDNNYGLLASIIHQIPELHNLSQWSLLSIPGIPDKAGKILLTRQSCVRIRVPVPQIPLVYQLAGKKIHVGKHEVHIGIPAISMLRAASTLKARIVTIKNCMEPSTFLTAARRQMDALGIGGELSIPLNRDGMPSRKTIKIKRHSIVGFTTKVTGLNDEDSLKLQEEGLGGRRHMGCGYFLPSK